MVQSGVMRAYGAELRRFLGQALRNRFRAFGFGLVVTALLQSSTATALMTTSFTADGVVTLASALAIMLGANVGTTLIVQVLSFDVSAVSPVLLLAGVIAFKNSARGRVRVPRRVAIGLAPLLPPPPLLLPPPTPPHDTPACPT